MIPQEKSTAKSKNKKSTLLKTVEQCEYEKIQEILDSLNFVQENWRELDKTIRICLKSPNDPYGDDRMIEILIQKQSPYKFDPKLGECWQNYYF